MKSSKPSTVVLVTNAHSHIGSTVIKQLADQPQYEVRSTVENLAHPATHSFKKVFPHVPIWEVDMENYLSLKKAFRGVDYVIYTLTASSFSHLCPVEDAIDIHKGIITMATECKVKQIISIADDLLVYESWKRPRLDGAVISPNDVTKFRKTFVEYLSEKTNYTDYSIISCGTTFGPISSSTSTTDGPACLLQYLHDNYYALPIKSVCSDVRDVADVIEIIIKRGLRKQRILLGKTMWMKEIGEICQDIHSPFDSAFATQDMTNGMLFLNELLYKEFRSDMIRIQKYFFTNFETDTSDAERLLGRKLKDTREAIKISAEIILNNHASFSDLEKTKSSDMLLVSFLAALLGFGCMLLNDYITAKNFDVLTWRCSSCPDMELCRNPQAVFGAIFGGTAICTILVDCFLTQIQVKSQSKKIKKPLKKRQRKKKKDKHSSKRELLKNLNLTKQVIWEMPLHIVCAMAFIFQFQKMQIPDLIPQHNDVWCLGWMLHTYLKWNNTPENIYTLGIQYFTAYRYILCILCMVFDQGFRFGDISILFAIVKTGCCTFFLLASIYALYFKETALYYDFIHLAFSFRLLPTVMNIFAIIAVNYWEYTAVSEIEKLFNWLWFSGGAIFNIYTIGYFWMIDRVEANHGTILFCVTFNIAISISTYSLILLYYVDGETSQLDIITDFIMEVYDTQFSI